MKNAVLLNELSYNEKLRYIAEYDTVKKSKAFGFALALIFGGFGAHHFYMGNWRLGILYVLLWASMIPAVIAWVEMFFMPARIENYNNRESIRLIQQLKGTMP